MLTVLVLCTGNSARSLIAEAVLNAHGDGRFRAFSAGSRPRGAAHPVALATLTEAGYATDALRSKSWDEFAAPQAPPLDAVITLCDSAANEACPVWPGAPVTAHWGLPDPAAENDPERCRAAFAATLAAIEWAVGRLSRLPPEALTAQRLEGSLRAIGEEVGAPAQERS